MDWIGWIVLEGLAWEDLIGWIGLGGLNWVD